MLAGDACLHRLAENANSAALPEIPPVNLCDLLPPENAAIPPHPMSASHNFHRHIIGGCGSGSQADGLAHHKGHGFGLGFADLLGGEGAALAAMEHLVGLCCRQHKPIYVAQNFMWRSPQGGPEDAPSRADTRHITSGFRDCEGTP